MKTVEEAVSEVIFRDAAQVFAVLDGASVPGLLGQLHKHKPQSVCLYRGELKPDMQQMAPYLVQLEPGSEFTQWVLQNGWGKHWGVFATTGGDLFTMRQHFRKFLRVYDEKAKPMLFRYYDPRVLRTYLPTCNPGELADFFGPVKAFVMEGDDPARILQFTFRSPELVKSETAAAAAKSGD
jgi:hypothetical protein